MLLWSVAVLALADPPPAEAVAALCAGRSPCQPVDHHYGGVDATGHDLQVVELLLSDIDDSEARGPAYGGPCHALEHHVLRYDGDKVIAHRLIQETCNDGYGASGVGEDRFEIEPNRFTHNQNGGSSWRWGRGRVEELWPGRVLEEWRSSWRSPMGNEESTRWSWETLSGEGTRNLVVCGEEEATLESRSVLLPLAPPWPEPGTGPCAATVDSANPHGMVTHGGPGNPDDARLSVARTPDGLRIDVVDDHWVRDAERWIHADHIELWLPASAEPNNGYCAETWPAHQWGISLDGTVYPGHGAPPLDGLKATATFDAAGAHLQLTLPEGAHDRLTVVYSDSDDGTQQERLLATSALRPGDAYSLGAVKDLTSSGVCTPQGLVKHRWDPRFVEFFGEATSTQLLRQRFQFDAVRTAADWELALDQALTLQKALEPKVQELFDAQPDSSPAFLDWAMPHLGGWHADIYGEGSTLLLDLPIEPWAAAASRTAEPEDDAYGALLALAWGNLSKTGSPTWRTQTWDGGGCSDLGDGEFLAVLKRADAARAAGTRFEAAITQVRSEAIDAIVGPTQMYPFCHGTRTDERTKAELEAEVRRILEEVRLSDTERGRLKARLAIGFAPGPFPEDSP